MRKNIVNVGTDPDRRAGGGGGGGAWGLALHYILVEVCSR